MRKKECEKCKKDFRIMFRVQYTTEKKWVFLCTDCVSEVKRDNEDYRYGGTWILICATITVRVVIKSNSFLKTIILK